MDQPTLGCKYPVIHTPDVTTSASAATIATSNSTSHRPLLLRRVSHSDPHLDIPHFMSVQDKGFHGFHTTLSQLFENPTSTFSVNKMGSQEDHSVSGHHIPVPKASIDRNKSAFELCTTESNTQPPIRKVSSVANYNDVDSTVQAHNNSGSLISSALHYVTGNNSHSTANEDQGLTMNVRSNSGFSPSALPSSTAGLASMGQADLSVGSTTDSNSSTGTLNRVKSGMFGVFNRGFFAKPVMVSPEESYRYIMTMDR
ncbi:hypothetical protein M3Y98_00368800 [Aphelenchoides besseyi]|nr:hypothetical protein M3Y98_00368800 [Aphelenchoides besseyi]KAI6201786.1 hypothetical protein M3Y96_00879500 [Aphelenchoides besseyi]